MLRVVSVDEAQEILTDVIREDYERSLSSKLGLALSPNWNAYRILEQYGILYSVVAEHDGKPIGYACITFSRSNHYDAMCATVDSLWVLKEFRSKSRVGLMLIKEIEREAKARKADLINFHFQEYGNLDCILDKFGYSPTDVVMSKRINHG